MGTRNAHNTIPSSSRIFDISSVECGDDKDDDDEDSDGGISTNCDSFSFHTALFESLSFFFPIEYAKRTKYTQFPNELLHKQSNHCNIGRLFVGAVIVLFK